jgi:glycogen operon protein
VFRRRRYLAGAQASELRWFTPAGTPMTAAGWADPSALSLGIYLDGSDDPDPARDGTLLLDDDFLVFFNAWWEPLDFVIPATRETPSGSTPGIPSTPSSSTPGIPSTPSSSTPGIPSTPAAEGQRWRAEIDSHDPAAAAPAGERHAGDRVTVGPRSVTVLRSPRPGR